MEAVAVMSSDATVTSRGHITIPADVRKAMGLEPGARAVFSRLDDGTTVMHAKTRSIRASRAPSLDCQDR